MLDTQVLRDQQGMPMGVFIPMSIWENLIYNYPDIDKFDNELPQWEKDFIDRRLDIALNHPERLNPIEMLFEGL
jgi:hypothetical protein